MPSRRDYDDEFRASAVLMLEAAGYPVRRGALQDVSLHLHVPDRTLARWFKLENNPAPAKLVAIKRKTLSEMIEDEIVHIFAAMQTVRDEASYRDLATAAGILTDKLQLLQGKPTERTEHQGNVTLTHEQRLARITEILVTSRDRGDRLSPELPSG